MTYIKSLGELNPRFRDEPPTPPPTPPRTPPKPPHGPPDWIEKGYPPKPRPTPPPRE